MPTRAQLVTRTETTSTNTENLNKGSKLSFAEMDSNFLELRDQTIGIADDSSTVIDVAAGNTLTVTGANGIQTTVSGQTLTIDGSGLSSLGDITAVGSTLISPSNADFTIQASGTGQIVLDDNVQVTGSVTATTSIENDAIRIDDNKITTTRSNDKLIFDTAGTGPIDFSNNFLINVADPFAAQDAATKAYVDAQVLASGDTGDLTINGSTITAPSNADLTLTVAGTGQIVVDGTLTATEVISDLTGTVEFDAKATVALTKGEVIYIAGIDGNTPTVGKARANSSSTMPAFGIAAENIALNATGKITTFGSLTGLDAADFGETSITFALRDTLYVSSAEAGKLTNVAPTGESNFIQNIGKVERASPTTNITIKVGGAGRSNATPALNDGNIFIGNASNQSSTVALSEQIKNYKAITVVGDDSTGTDINIGETFQIAGSGGITTAVSGDTLTIDGSGVTGSGADLGNLQVNDTTLSPITTNDDLVLTANGTGDVQIQTDSGSLLYVGENKTNNYFSFLPSSGILRWNSSGSTPAIFQHNNGGLVQIENATTDKIRIQPNTTGGEVIVGPTSGIAYVSSSGANDLKLWTNSGTDSGSITITDGVNGDITISPNGTGVVNVGTSRVTNVTDPTSAQDAATKAYVDATAGSANTGDITFVGSTMSSPSNADFTIETAGTGKIILTGLAFPDTDGTADQVLGTNGSGVLSFRDPTAINIDGGVADSVYTSTPSIDGGVA